jgi:hypothetical protein
MQGEHVENAGGRLRTPQMGALHCAGKQSAEETARVMASVRGTLLRLDFSGNGVGFATDAVVEELQMFKGFAVPWSPLGTSLRPPPPYAETFREQRLAGGVL